MIARANWQKSITARVFQHLEHLVLFKLRVVKCEGIPSYWSLSGNQCKSPQSHEHPNLRKPLQMIENQAAAVSRAVLSNSYLFKYVW